MKFEDAIEYVLENEGDYVDDADDKGQATHWGISKRAHPDVDIKNLTREQAIEIYRREYWEPNQDILKLVSDNINPKDKEGMNFITNKVFDTLINIGRKNTIKILQRCVNANTIFRLKEDGILGSQTCTLLDLSTRSESGRNFFYVAFKCERASYYRVLAAKDPTQEKFLAGWLRRAYQ